jgi:SAM-dependent methyltransferase
MLTSKPHEEPVAPRDSASAEQPITRDIAAINRTFYEALWSRAHLERPSGFNTWPLVSEFLPSASARLELGPGLRPRLPIAGTHFIDMSASAIQRLNARGGIAVAGELGVLPFRDREFDLVCAFDVIEHVEDDQRVFGEVSRVLKDNGVLIVSVPLHVNLWTEFDDCVGHARRYAPADLLAILAAGQLAIEKSAVFGMQPANTRLLKWGMWYLEHQRTRAMFWYNWVGMPVAKFFQKRLELASGLIETNGVHEIVLVCRRGVRRSVPHEA